MSNRVHAAFGTPPEGAEAAQLPREYGKMAAQCAAEGVDHPEYLLRLAELSSSTPPASAWWSAGSGRPGSRP